VNQSKLQISESIEFENVFINLEFLNIISEKKIIFNYKGEEFLVKEVDLFRGRLNENIYVKQNFLFDKSGRIVLIPLFSKTKGPETESFIKFLNSQKLCDDLGFGTDMECVDKTGKIVFDLIDLIFMYYYYNSDSILITRFYYLLKEYNRQSAVIDCFLSIYDLFSNIKNCQYTKNTVKIWKMIFFLILIIIFRTL